MPDPNTSTGGPPLGPATHGIYVRDMSDPNGEVIRILDRTMQVPGPNNLGSTFTETPSFPRIDLRWPVIATRGNHQPVHRYELDDGSETRAGTTGIYTNPFGELMMGEANFGHAPGQGQFGVPEFSNQRFEVFPGSPSITDGDTIVFKGNYTVGDSGKTGVYFRKLVPGPTGGESPAIMIANSGVASMGKPSPRMPWASPAKRKMAAPAIQTAMVRDSASNTVSQESV